MSSEDLLFCCVASGTICLYTTLLIVVLLSLGGGVVMVGVGSACISQKALEWCPSQGGSIAILVVGILMTVFCCCGGVKISFGNRKD